MNNASIRLARTDDAGTIARFRLALLSEGRGGGDAMYAAAWSRLFAQWIAGGTLRYWLAEDDAMSAIGGAGVLLRPIFPHPSRLRPIEARLQNFYVVPHRRGEGIGSDFLARIIARLREEHINRVVVHPSKAARDWYARNAFAAIDEMILDLR